MKKTAISASLTAATAALCLAGCLNAPFQPPTGMAFSQYQAPLSIDHNKTAITAKKGQAESICILGLVSLGDCSTQAAAQAGGLTTVEHADYDYYNVLGVFQRTTVIVYGK